MTTSNPQPTTPSPCKRCSNAPADQKIKAEPVCAECFKKYVATKAIKHMETFRVRDFTKSPRRRILLPLSFGPCSTTLLYLLSAQLERQLSRSRRTLYDLHIVHVVSSEGDRGLAEARTEAVKARFPQHSYGILSLSSALSLPSLDLASLNLSSPSQDPSQTPEQTLANILASLPSATSRQDITSTLLTRLLVSHAQSLSCTTILFGDTTTRLAERTLSQTAKGRGFSLPYHISDGASPYDPSISFSYPLRELLRKEVIAFSCLPLPCSIDRNGNADGTEGMQEEESKSLEDLIIYETTKEISASSKNNTIDDLMKQYFEGVEESYPGIVMNVVRTTAKLKAKDVGSEGEEGRSGECGCCGLPVEEGMGGTEGWAGDQTVLVKKGERGGEGDGDGERDVVLCYGCERSIRG